tara:strand:+ start:534 stop:1016 length:483 start_codon:yes stop_codon:yes gene_type:complete
MKNTVIDLDLFTFKNGVVTYNGREVTQTKSTNGYVYVWVANKHRRLHRVVAAKYIANPNNLPHIDHIDDDKHNNDPSNLQWITPSANSKKAYASLGFKLKCHEGAVSIMAKKGNEQLIFPSVRAASRHLGRSCAAVSNVLNGQWHRCAGYTMSRVSIITE